MLLLLESILVVLLAKRIIFNHMKNTLNLTDTLSYLLDIYVVIVNVLSIFMQCFALTCAMSVLWLVCGYSLSFSDGNGVIGGLSECNNRISAG